MDPYAKPGARRVGANRPVIRHLSPQETRSLTPGEREQQKQQVAAERRAIKKSARRHLARELREELRRIERI